uniref:Putative tigger transposable element-derived n=1 Tax=Rhipicephalus microplus TaxID=6941 RepID=A0A6G5AGE6_RHIMP
MTTLLPNPKSNPKIGHLTTLTTVTGIGATLAIYYYRLQVLNVTPATSDMHSYTVKIEVVQWHCQARRNVHATARQFSIDRKRVRKRDKKFESLLQHNFGMAKLRRKLSNGAPSVQ